MSTTLTDKNSNGFPARSGVAAGDFISSADINQHLEALGERTNYLYTMGICPHNATFNYPIGAFCQDNGTVYRAQVGNAGKPPASNPAIWTRCPMTAAEIADAINLSDKQPVDATLTALAGLNTSADRLIYATGADQFALTPLTAFIRTLLDDADAATARATLGAAPLASPALTGIPTAPTASTGTRTTQLATTAFVGAESQIAAPTGSVYTFAGATVPTGWLKCNGALLSRTTYAALFAVIGTAYGAGDGSTTFALPDLRGEFVRGFDDARGVDSGRALGSKQGDAIRNLSGEVRFQTVDGNDQLVWLSSGVFSHGADAVLGGHNQIASVASGSWEQVLSFSADKVVPTAAENRPRNVAMHYIIKY